MSFRKLLIAFSLITMFSSCAKRSDTDPDTTSDQSVDPAGELEAPVATGQDDAIGSFVYFEGKDSFDDTDRSVVASSSTAPGQPAMLAWKCMEDGLNVLYIFGRYKGGDSDDEVLVRFRFDKNPPKDHTYWALLQGQESAHIPMQDVESFTSQARSSNQVLLEVVDPLDGEVQRDTFKLDGLAAALGRLSCAR